MVLGRAVPQKGGIQKLDACAKTPSKKILHADVCCLHGAWVRVPMVASAIIAQLAEQVLWNTVKVKAINACVKVALYRIRDTLIHRSYTEDQ